MSYRIDHKLTKTEDQEWVMMPMVGPNPVATFAADARDALITPIDNPALIAKITDPARYVRTKRDEFTWDRTWIDDNTLIKSFYFDTLEKLEGYYLDMQDFQPNPTHKTLSYYNVEWKAYDPDGNEIELPLV
jgi:hypothetical protein